MNEATFAVVKEVDSSEGRCENMLDQLIRAALREYARKRKFPDKHDADVFVWMQNECKDGL